MEKLTARLLFLLLTFCVCFPAAGTENPQEPLRASELLGLVAGAALPENVVAEIQHRGLSFPVDDFFRTQMQKAGADPTVLTALNAAKIAVNEGSRETANKDLLEHISNAAELMQKKSYDEAARELNAVLTTNFQSPECGFVMGQLLRVQGRWQEAAAVYTETLRQDPNFPEVHTKLSFILYSLG
ncbi:MAG: tetratricopeptide repeat protein, partial [Candidatus Acidiferrales bacterium]